MAAKKTAKKIVRKAAARKAAKRTYTPVRAAPRIASAAGSFDPRVAALALKQAAKAYEATIPADADDLPEGQYAANFRFEVEGDVAIGAPGETKKALHKWDTLFFAALEELDPDVREEAVRNAMERCAECNAKSHEAEALGVVAQQIKSLVESEAKRLGLVVYEPRKGSASGKPDVRVTPLETAAA